MKTIFLNFAFGLLVVAGISGCKDDEETPADNNLVTYKVTLSGTNETPVNASTATGSATFTYNKTTYILTGTVTFTGLTPTGAHIHKGASGVAGGVIFPLGTAPFTSPITFTSPALDATQQADLKNGLYYVNIHSASFPGGEIRGQLGASTSDGTGGGGGY